MSAKIKRKPVVGDFVLVIGMDCYARIKDITSKGIHVDCGDNTGILVLKKREWKFTERL